MLHKLARVSRYRLTALAVGEAGMSTVEYSTGCKTYRERIPWWLLQRRGVPRLFGR